MSSRSEACTWPASNTTLAKVSHSNPTCKPSATRALAKPVAHKTCLMIQSTSRALDQSRKPWANAQRLIDHTCHGINQPTCVSTRFLNLLAATCATGYASVFTIGGLYVAWVEHYFGKVVSFESHLQAFGNKSTGKASGTQDVQDDSISEPRDCRLSAEYLN